MGQYKIGGKPIHRSKTMWVSALTFSGAAGIIVAEYRWPGMFGAEVKAACVALIIAALGFGALRLKTDSAVQ